MAMRVLLALLVVAASASSAFAIKAKAAPAITASCDVWPGTYPASGATEVPRNTRVWIFAGTRGQYDLWDGNKRQPLKATLHEPFRMIELVLPHLDANAMYTVLYGDRSLVTFTTGEDDIVSLPDPPELVRANVSPRTGTPISIAFAQREQAPVFKVTVRTEHEVTPLFIPANKLYDFGGDCAGVHLASGQAVCFDVAAIDGAGNRSAATRYCTTVTDSRHKENCLGRTRAPTPNVGLLACLTGIALLSGIGFVKLSAQGAREARQRRSFAPVEIALVRPLARAQRIRAIVALVVCVTAIPLTGLTDINLAFVLATPLVACVIVAVAKAQRLQRVLMDLDAQNASATYDGDTYLFTQPHHWIAINPRQLERVIAASLPTAKIR